MPGGTDMSANDTYLAIFTSNKASQRWHARCAMSVEERRAKDEEGHAALKAWDEAHRESIVYEGGPIGPTKRMTPTGREDAVTELTVLRDRKSAGWGQSVNLSEELSG